ncbi:MAG: hypothetical protein LC725_10535, partial [Lentisphaerae bacterium]|nr:hypothetical protein [Lentisphaerota bacterium]
MKDSMDAKYRRLFQNMAVKDTAVADLRGRVLDAVHAQSRYVAVRRYRFRRQVWFIVHGLAAVAALCLMVWYLVPRASYPPSGAMKLAINDNAAIPQERRAAGALLFREMEALFGKQLDWVCENGGEVCMGLHSALAPVSGAPLLVRLTVQRQDDRQQWQHY